MKKILFGLLALFVLGNVSGVFIGARFQHDRHEQRDKVGNLEINMMDFLTSKLSLSVKQVDEIQPMVGEACVEIQSVYKSGSDQIEQIFLRYHDLIALKLTPEQDVIFKDLEAKRQRDNAEKHQELPDL